MIFRHGPKNLNGASRVGMLLLAVASLFLLVTRVLDVSVHLADRASGVLYGVSIGFLLVGLRQKGRQRTTGDGPCG